MNKIFFLIFLMLVGTSCYLSRIMTHPNGENLFKIVRIKNMEKYYEIHVSRNDSLFKFISFNDKCDSLCNKNMKIRRNGYYDLDSILLLTPDSMFNKPMPVDLSVSHISPKEGIVVSLEQKFNRKVYMSQRLCGLCLKK